MVIRKLREVHKLSQAELAEKLGITAATVSHMENGRMKISDRIADRIRQEFGEEIETGAVKKPVAGKTAGQKAAAAKKPAVKKAAPKLEIYIQSPLGGNITPEEVAAKMPEGTECCFVRVDQNLIWWVRGEETGAVEIWESDRA